MTKVLESGIEFSQRAEGDDYIVNRMNEPGELYIDHTGDGALIGAENDGGYVAIEIPVEQFGKVKAKLEQIRHNHEGER